MGWTTTHKPVGTSAKAYMDNMFTQSGEHGSWKVLDSGVVRFRTYYAAIERTLPDGTRYVFAAVCKLGYYPKSEYNFGYKDMDESMGPCESECPERILKLLTPIEQMPNGGNESSAAWRKRCWDKIEARKRAPKLVDGITLYHERGLSYQGELCHWFTVSRTPGDRKVRIWCVDGGFYVKFPRQELPNCVVRDISEKAKRIDLGRVETILACALYQLRSSDPDDVLPLIEESLTIDESRLVEGFLRHANSVKMAIPRDQLAQLLMDYVPNGTLV